MEKETLEKKLAALEALLFIHGEPMPVKKIAEVFKLSPEEAEILVKEYAGQLESESRGITLITLGDRIQLATKPELNSSLEEFVKGELSEELSPASLEVMSLIAYLGPISRAKLEYIRGVNSSFILRSLMIRGLVDRKLDPKNSIAYLYEPTFELLAHLGVKSSADLPEYEKFRELLNEAQNAEPTVAIPDIPVSESPVT